MLGATDSTDLDGTALNESPSEKEGKCRQQRRPLSQLLTLNESPSEKEGKFLLLPPLLLPRRRPSIKAPPKRKGNLKLSAGHDRMARPSMKAPPKRKGNYGDVSARTSPRDPSMKAPPKRKGNRAQQMSPAAAVADPQ